MLSLLLAIIYLAFISLGLPDSLLGSAWPVIYREFSVPLSYSGGIFMIISGGTILSSLCSDRLTKAFGTGRVTAGSVLMTAAALFGFSVSHSYFALCLWALPYGLGAGSVDASLNNYVAFHYASKHMSWLHCMWGIGASAGPYIMGYALTGGLGWNMGYRYIAVLQIILSVILIVSLPLWNGRKQSNPLPANGTQTNDTSRTDSGAQTNDASRLGGTVVEADSGKNTANALSLLQIFRIPGAKEIMATFFCYCTIEQTTGLWAGSYLVLHQGLSAETAASLAGLFFIGITAGRFISGFLTWKLGDTQMIRLGQALVLTGILLLLLPFGTITAFPGLILVGLGCAPIYPSIIHSTPANFGEDKSQALIGVQMASAYTGNLLMPPLFGFLANHISVSLFPFYLLIFLIVMALLHKRMLNKIRKERLK